MEAIALVGVIAALLFFRQPLVVILLAAIGYIHLVWGRGQLDYIVEDLWVSLDKELILAIPMFLLCGGVMTKGTAARRLVRIAASLTRHIPGGLAVASVLACGIFAAISGSSIVTMLAIGSVMYPAMQKAGYSNRFALGTVMCAGTLGIIIPPSIPLIVYGLVTETSIVELFLAGVGPGLLLMGLMIAYAVWVNRGIKTEPFSMSEVRSAFREGIWALLMPVILLGGIYSGYFSATESAAVSLAYALLVELFIHRELKIGDFGGVIIDAAKLSGSLFPLLAVALSFNIVLSEHHVPNQMVELMQSWFSSPLAFVVLVNLLLLGVGAMMTTNEAILILAPLLAPVAEAYGLNKIVFGIMMIVNLEIGLLTPPVGINLLVAMGAFRQSFGNVVVAALPFIAIMIIGLAIIAWRPELTLFLIR
ncbi:MAG: TRAP transporter large permease [Rhizobacter sp.]|nr:TRAP transporter large permease [Rhizobacter sp.]